MVMTYKEKLFQVAKIIAENDSIAEGYSYHETYSEVEFESDFETNLNYAPVAKTILDLLEIKE